MAETLTEKVARAIAEADRTLTGYDDPMYEIDPHEAARAAIAVVIEEAVRAAEREYGQAGAGGISDAIRRLAE